MARPTETEKLLAELLKATKKGNSQTDSLEGMAAQSALSDGRRPVKSVKPTLFVTGTRASQADYIAARTATSQEKFVKSFEKDKADTKKKEKKQGVSDKKEKADKEKREDKNLEKQLEISNKMLDVLEVGVKEEDKSKLDELRRQKSNTAQVKKNAEIKRKKDEASEKRNQGWIKNVFDHVTDNVSDQMGEIRDSFEDNLKLGSKERREFAKQEREDAKVELERVRDMIINSQQDSMTFQDKQLAKIIEANDMSIEIQGLEKGVQGISVDIVKAVNEKSEKETNLQREFYNRTGQSLQNFRDEQRKQKELLGRDTFEYRQWIRKNADEVQASQDFSIKLSEHSIAVNSLTSKKVQKQNERSQDLFKDIKEAGDYVSENIVGLQEESIKSHKESLQTSKNLEKVVKKSAEGTTDAVTDFAKQEKDSSTEAKEIAEEVRDDAKADFRDNFLKRAKEMGLRAAMVESLKDLVSNSNKTLKATKNNQLKTGGKKGGSASGGGVLGTLAGLGIMKWLGPKLKKIPFIGKLLGGLGDKMGKMSGKGMLLGSLMGGGGIAEALMGGVGFGDETKTGPKQATKAGAKKGVFSRMVGGVKSAGAKAMSLIPGAGVMAKGAGIGSKVMGGVSKFGLGALSKFIAPAMAAYDGVTGFASASDTDRFGADAGIGSKVADATAKILDTFSFGLLGRDNTANFLTGGGLDRARAKKKLRSKAKSAKAEFGLDEDGFPYLDAQDAQEGAEYKKLVAAKKEGKGKQEQFIGTAISSNPILSTIGHVVSPADKTNKSINDELRASGMLVDGKGINQEGSQNSSIHKGVIQTNNSNISSISSIPVTGDPEKMVTENTLAKERTLLRILTLLEQKEKLGKVELVKEERKEKVEKEEKKKSIWEKMKDGVKGFFGMSTGGSGGGNSSGGGSGGSVGGGGGSFGSGGSSLAPENNKTGLNDQNLTNLKAALGQRESSNNYKAVNGGNYIGKYQMGAMALIDIGLVKKGTKNRGLDDPSNWEQGSKEQFLNDPELQEKSMDKMLNINAGYLGGAKGETQGKIAGMLAASHLLGAGGAKKGPGGKDGNGTTWSEYYKLGMNSSSDGGSSPLANSSGGQSQSSGGASSGQSQSSGSSMGTSGTSGTSSSYGGQPSISNTPSTQGGSAAIASGSGGQGSGNYSGKPLDGLKPDARRKLDKLNSSSGGAGLYIVSAYRSPSYNTKVGGAKGSMHMKGQAIDIRWPNMSTDAKEKFIKLAGAAGFTGIGVYPGFIHVDTGKKRAWGSNGSRATLPQWASNAIAGSVTGSPDTSGAMAGGTPETDMGNSGGTGGKLASGTGMVNGTASAIGTGTSDNGGQQGQQGQQGGGSIASVLGDITQQSLGGSSMGPIISKVLDSTMSSGKLGNMGNLPFGNILSQLAGGQGKFNSNMLNSQNVIGQGVNAMASSAISGIGDFAPPYVSTIADSAMDILKGRSLFDS